MNPIDRILSEVTDEQLRSMVEELRELGRSSVLPDGEVRKLKQRLMDEVGIPDKDARSLAWSEPLRLAAFRWAVMTSPAAASAKVTEFIGLKSRETGELVRLHTTNEDHGTGYFLSKNPSHPLFQAQSPGQIRRILFASTPHYNATEDQPGWGLFDGDDLVPVRVRLTQTMENHTVEPSITVKTVDIRDTHIKVARGYAGRDIVTDGADQLVRWLVLCPEGQTFEDMKALEGKNVHSERDALTHRKVYAVCEVPEEVVPELKGKPGAVLIASEARFED